MVATQALATATLGIGAYEAARRFPIPGVQQRTDLAIKALVGVALIAASFLLIKENGWAKATVIGAGVGLLTGAGIPLAQSMR